MLFIFYRLLKKLFNLLQTCFIKQTKQPFPKRNKYKTQKPEPPETIYYHRQRKPQWVVNKVIYLAALMPDKGYRSIASAFNRQNQYTQQMTISKSYVGYTLKNHHYDVLHKRREIRRKKARVFPGNQQWSMDITYLKDQDHITHTLLGIMDNGSRYCLHLKPIPDKSSWVIIKTLLKICWRYGKPKTLKTDNEPCFTSKLFCTALTLLNIEHKRSDTYCPWQNGHIERLFGTLKQTLKRYTLSALHTQNELAQFQFWYNYCRPHQNLKNNRTPAEQHLKKCYNHNGDILFLSFWEDTLTGFYLPPD